MTFPSKRGISVDILGVGPKKSADEPMPSFGRKAAPASDTPPEGEASSDLTPDMLEYHAGGMTCGSCKHFTAPSTCDRWSDPVEDSGYCNGWQGDGAEAGMGEQDMGMEGEQQ